MSRIGRAPITVPAGVEVKVDGQHVSVKGPKGALEMNVAPTMKVEVEAGVVHVTRPNDDKMNRSLHGLTRTVIMPETEDIQIDVPNPNQIIVKGIDKQKVGQFAAEVRGKRPPEPYKGKGIKYDYEVIRRKEGKTGAK